jgi:membrane associated rhomboid family serine protease
VFVPVYDENPLRSIKRPYVTIALIIVNIVTFLCELTGTGQMAVASFALVPAELFDPEFLGRHAFGPQDAYRVPEALTLLTYMFLHADPFHLAGNMLFLWVFGDNVEDAMGHARYLAFFLLSGVSAGLIHAVMAPVSNIPLIGASGAVAGIVIAYLMLHPRVRVWIIAFRFIPLRIRASWVLGAWIVTQLAMLIIPGMGPIAWWAHAGGILTGAVLVLFLRRPGVALFGRGAPTGG